MKERLAPRRKPKQQRSAASREAILTATRRVLLDKGYAGLNTTRVAEVAGVSVGSLYQYFPLKDALLAAVVDEFLDTLRATILVSAAADAPTLEEAVRQLIDGLLRAKA